MKKQLLATALLVLALLPSGNAYAALSTAQIKALQSGVYYANTEDDSCSGSTDTTTGGTTFLANQDQAKIAQIIIGIAKTDNLGQRGALIGLMAGLAESGLKIYANANIAVSLTNPAKQAIGHDHSSVGVFQQQPQFTWSTIATGPGALTNKDAVWQLMDPAYSAEAFFGSPRGTNAPDALSKGVQDKTNWLTAETWVVAQEVQGSQFNGASNFGSNYKAKLPAAQALLTKYWDSSPAVPLPVPLTGGGNATPSNNITPTTLCPSSTTIPGTGTGKFVDNTSITFPGIADTLARAKELADPNSALFKSVCNQISNGQQIYCTFWCAHVVGEAWGHDHTGYPSAAAQWQSILASGQAHPGDRNPPIGALLFYDGDKFPGHAALYLGNNLVLSTDVLNASSGRVGGIYITSASSIESGPWHLQYSGWTPPIFK